MISIIILSVKIIFLSFFLGFGIARILLPKKLEEYALWFSPWLGLVLTVLMAIALNLGGIPLSKGKYLILLISLLLLIISFFLKRRKISLNEELFGIAFLTGLSFLLNILPLLYKVRFPTSISFGNLDVLTYSNVGDYLINNTINGIKALQPLNPYSWSVVDFLLYSFRWGSPMILGFFSSVFNLRSYQVFTILVNLFFSLMLPLTYIYSKILFPKNKYLLLLLTFITFSLNSTILYMLYHVFFGQFIFMGLYLMVLILMQSYIEEIDTRKHAPNNYDFLIGLTTAAVATIYPEGLLFILAPMFGLFTFNFFFNKERLFYLLTFLKIIFITIIISPVTFGLSIKQNIKLFVSTIGVTFIGWEKIRNANPIELVGLYNINYSKELTFTLAIIFGLAVVLIWIIALTRIKNKILITMNLLMVASFLIMYRYISPNFFTYHRALTYTIFLYVILFAIGIAYMFSLFKNTIVKILIVLTFLVLAVRSYYRTYNLFYVHSKVIDRPLASLLELNDSKKITETFLTSDVYFAEFDLWKRVWREYFLQNKSIVTRQNYVMNTETAKNLKLVLSEKNYLEKDGKQIIYKNIVWQNQYYVLGEILPLEVAEDLKIY